MKGWDSRALTIKRIRHQFFGMEVSVVQGDIAEQSADVLVNAAGTSLRMGSGVAGALRRKGGEALNEEAMNKGPVDLGEVVITDSHDLDADYVIHAAAMPHFGDGQATSQSIATATRKTLEAADEVEAESIVIPALGCGVAGFDIAAGVRRICEEIAAHEPESLQDIRLIGYADDEYRSMKAVASDVLEIEE